MLPAKLEGRAPPTAGRLSLLERWIDLTFGMRDFGCGWGEMLRPAQFYGPQYFQRVNRALS